MSPEHAAGSPQPPTVVRIDQIEAVPGPGSLVWRPVRLTLGVRAFGCNAYTATEAGQDVVEAHDEVPNDGSAAQEELYFVAAGRASFTIDGAVHDAPAGTYVFIPDARSHRHAVAAEPGTTVLSFGGPPTFQPSAWEWVFRAAPLMRSDPARAGALLAEGLALHPHAPGLHYNLACLHAVQGRREDALACLQTAIELDAKAAQWARADDDLASLREDPEFQALVGG